MRRLLFLLAFAPGFGCVGHIRTEMMGHGNALVVPRGTPPPTEATGIQLPHGAYDLALRFQVPRAQLVEWHVTCPGATSSGSVGESFEAYRTRRIAAIRAMRVVPPAPPVAVAPPPVAVAPVAVVPPPPVRVRGTVVVPIGPGQIRVRGKVDVTPPPAPVAPQAAPPLAPVYPEDAPAEAPAPEPAPVTDDVVELPPGDVGAGVFTTGVHVETAADGVCTVTAVADDGNVIGTYDVVRVRDLDAEARVRRMALTTGAVKVRARLTEQLVAAGAEAGLHARLVAERRAAAVRVRVEAEAHAQWVIESRRSEAWRIRREYIAYLVGRCGADPEVRERERARIAAEREARLRKQRELDAQASLRLEVERAQAARDEEILVDRERQRVDAALRIRGQLRTYLLARGAIVRPPMPELLAENPGPKPFANALWASGHWEWREARWMWHGGGWRIGPVETVAPARVVVETPVPPPPVVEAPATVVVEQPGVVLVPPVVVVPPAVRVQGTIDHRRPRREPPPPPKKEREKERDHRR